MKRKNKKHIKWIFKILLLIGAFFPIWILNVSFANSTPKKQTTQTTQTKATTSQKATNNEKKKAFQNELKWKTKTKIKQATNSENQEANKVKPTTTQNKDNQTTTPSFTQPKFNDEDSTKEKKENKEEECVEVEKKKECKEGEESCEHSSTITEKICKKVDKVELPTEVLALYKKIEEKYGGTGKKAVEYNWKTYDNSTIIYSAVAMKELKDWIQWIDNQVKIDYEMAKLSKIALWNIDVDWMKGYTPWVRWLRAYMTSAMFVKASKVLEALYESIGSKDVSQKIASATSDRLEWIWFVLDHWLWFAIALRENGWYWWDENWQWKELIKTFANNWWIFQLTDACGKISWNSLDEWTWAWLYLSGKWIWTAALFYALNEEQTRKSLNSWNAYDANCRNIYWAENYKSTPEKLIKLWQTYAQLDSEYYLYLKNGLFKGSANEAELYEYMGRELQFIFQFWNWSWFMKGKYASKRKLDVRALTDSSWSNTNNWYKFLKQLIDTIKPWNTYTQEDWYKDVVKWWAYAKAWYTWDSSFIISEKLWSDFPDSSLQMKFLSPEHWADFILWNFSWWIGSRYNGVWAKYTNHYNNSYVNSMPTWMLIGWFGLPEGCWMLTQQYWMETAAWGKWWMFSSKGFVWKNWFAGFTKVFLNYTYKVPTAFSPTSDWALRMMKYLSKHNNKAPFNWPTVNNTYITCLNDWSILY